MFGFPPVDLHMDSGNLVVTMDVPGVAKDSVDIEYKDGYLTVSGTRASPAEKADKKVLERPSGKFSRSII